ncbi:MAG: hypothetical protein WBH40_07155 [Ignavibacteriaceae bacterium]
MYKKLISSILVVALLNLVGCYSFESVSVPEYKQVEEEDGKPNEIKVVTKDFREYHFYDSGYYIHNDTLYGKVSVKELPLEGKFAYWEIESIQLENFDWYKPSLISVAELKKIEEETGKPDEIYLTKYDSTRYHFMKNDYYIEKDTLFGKGYLILDKEQPLDRKIDFSNIESIEVEKLNWGNTILLGLGIAATLFAIGAVVFMIGMSGMK